MKHSAIESALDALKNSALSDNYEFLEVLGAGGFGTVVKALHKPLSRYVAVKVVRTAGADDESFVRFMREAQLLSTFCHPNIARVYSYGQIGPGDAYLVMEFVDGVPLNKLKDEMERQGRSDYIEDGIMVFERFKAIFTQAAEALSVLHNAQIIHRDIKPDNLLFAVDEAGVEQIKLVDFGLAKCISPDAIDAQQKLTKESSTVGTPMYMSPEQCWGKVIDSRADLYSLACVMYEVATGRPPFETDSPHEMMVFHSTATVAPLTEREPRLRRWKGIERIQEIISCCLAKEPDGRFATPQKLIDALNSKTAVSGDIGATRRGERVVRMTSAAVGMAIIVALGSFWYARVSEKPPPPVALTSQDLFRQYEKIKKKRNDNRGVYQPASRMVHRGLVPPDVREGVDGKCGVWGKPNKQSTIKQLNEDLQITSPIVMKALEADRVDHQLFPKQRTTLYMAASAGYQWTVAREDADWPAKMRACEAMRTLADQALNEKLDVPTQAAMVSTLLIAAQHTSPSLVAAERGYSILKPMAKRGNRIDAAVLQLVCLYQVLGDGEAAQKAILELRESTLDSPAWTLSQAAIALRLGHNEEAAKGLCRCLSMDLSASDRFVATTLLSAAYIREGKLGEAKQWLDASKEQGSLRCTGARMLLCAHEKRWVEVKPLVDATIGLVQQDPRSFFLAFSDCELRDVALLARKDGQAALADYVTKELDRLTVLSRKALG